MKEIVKIIAKVAAAGLAIGAGTKLTKNAERDIKNLAKWTVKK